MKSKLLLTPVVVAALCLRVSAAVPDVSSFVAGGRDTLNPEPAGAFSSQATFARLVQAGHPAPDPASGILPDSPALRVDANTTTSPFAGVGSIFADDNPSDPVGFFGTGTAIDRWHVLTAAHLLDAVNNDGQPDVLPKNVQFVLNYGSDFSHIIRAAALALHPAYDGLANINDDLAILTLSEPLPAGVPIYPLADPSWLDIAPLIMAGYGESGDGVNGYTVGPEFHVKRTGANLLEAAELDDEGGPEVEVVAWDFEFEGATDLSDPANPSNPFDYFGIPFAFPNQIETMLGGGDSGGPSFMFNPNDPSDPNLYLAAVNTFSFMDPTDPNHDEVGKFGSGSGGIWLNSAYQAWIHATVPEASPMFANIMLAGAALLLANRICQRPCQW